MQLHGFLSEKIVTNKNKRNEKKLKKDRGRVTPGWTDISVPGPVSFLSRSSMYYITLTLHNPINLLNVVITVFLDYHLLHGVQTAETAGNCTINNSSQNSFVFPLSCQE